MERVPYGRQDQYDRHDHTLPGPGLAEVRITAASPDVARQAAQALRAWFASTEQRSYPAGSTGSGTRLDLVVDVTSSPAPKGSPPENLRGTATAGEVGV